MTTIAMSSLAAMLESPSRIMIAATIATIPTSTILMIGYAELLETTPIDTTALTHQDNMLAQIAHVFRSFESTAYRVK